MPASATAATMFIVVGNSAAASAADPANSSREYEISGSSGSRAIGGFAAPRRRLRGRPAPQPAAGPGHPLRHSERQAAPVRFSPPVPADASNPGRRAHQRRRRRNRNRTQARAAHGTARLRVQRLRPQRQVSEPGALQGSAPSGPGGLRRASLVRGARRARSLGHGRRGAAAQRSGQSPRSQSRPLLWARQSSGPATTSPVRGSR